MCTMQASHLDNYASFRSQRRDPGNSADLGPTYQHLKFDVHPNLMDNRPRHFRLGDAMCTRVTGESSNTLDVTTTTTTIFKFISRPPPFCTFDCIKCPFVHCGTQRTIFRSDVIAVLIRHWEPLSVLPGILIQDANPEEVGKHRRYVLRAKSVIPGFSTAVGLKILLGCLLLCEAKNVTISKM